MPKNIALALARALVGAVMLAFAPEIAAAKVITVYYMPFDVETYVPVTRATITCTAAEIWTISDQVQASRLRDLLKPRVRDNVPFDENSVHIKIVDDDQDTYLDADGGASRGQSSFRVDKLAFERFARSVKADRRRPNEDRPCK